MKLSPPTIGLLQASALTLYVLGVGLFFQEGERWAIALTPFLASSLLLLLFVISALVCALVVVGYPLWQFFEGQRKTALSTIVWSTFWLILFWLSFFALLFSNRI